MSGVAQGRAAQFKKAYLIPVIVALAFVGTLSTGANTDVILMVIIGVCAYILRKFKFDLAPFIIAFVLAEPIEYRLSQSMLYAKGAPLSYLFVQRPIASAFLVAALIWVGYLILRPMRRRAREPAAS